MYAEIALVRKDKDTDRLYTYEIPNQMKKIIQTGSKVSVPFGNGNKFLTGFVFKITSKKPNFSTKKIAELYAPIYGMSERQITLCEWIKERYACTYAQSIKTVMPKDLINAYKAAFFVQVSISMSIDSKDSISRFVRSNAKKQIKALEYLYEKKNAEEKVFMKETGIGKNSIERLIEKKLISRKTVSLQGFYRPQYKNSQCSPSPDRIICMLDASQRDNCYIHYILESLKDKRSVLVVSNEIEESRRIYRTVSNKLPGTNCLLHNNNLPLDELELIQKSLLSNQVSVVFGTRNSMFLPFNTLGLIIVDRESEYGHKSDSMPKFHSNEIAEYLKRTHNSRLVYSDITPQLRTFHYSSSFSPLIIGKDSQHGSFGQVSIVDMGQELRDGFRSILSRKLYQRINDSYKNNTGVILLLNQKGHSSAIACTSCGHTIKCPHCGLGLSFHSNDKMMRCPYCSYEVSIDTPCPECGRNSYRYLGLGPEKVDVELSKRFAGIRSCIVNKATIASTPALEAIADRFNNRDYDTLISTELILKNNLIKRPVLFGILNSDIFLGGQDFMANERFFSLVRKIRSCFPHHESELVIQTYDDRQIALKHVVKNDYKSFYNDEMNIRKALRLPPFYCMAVFHLFGDDEKNVLEISELYCANLKKTSRNASMDILGPSKRSDLRYKAKYKYQIVARYDPVDINRLKGIIKYVNNRTKEDFRKLSVKLSYDINARNL